MKRAVVRVCASSVATGAWLGAMLGVCGCGVAPRGISPAAQMELQSRATEVVKRAVRYKPLGSVRAQGIEVFQRRLPVDCLPWLRNALDDDDPGVRFAAILALGTLGDKVSYGRILQQADSKITSVRVAAYYALHRLGDTRYSARLPEVLLEDPSSSARRDAALVLGLLGERDAVKLLAKAMKDKDESVQRQALESMAMLGSAEAIQQLTFDASSGSGASRLAAVSALADLGRSDLLGTFKYKLQTGEYIEVKLAAARGLGRLGRADGLRIALESLDFNTPRRDRHSDPPRQQIARVRALAATALGAIGDARALPALRKRLYDSSDPHVQVAAADAILEILGRRNAPSGRSRLTTSHRPFEDKP